MGLFVRGKQFFSLLKTILLSNFKNADFMYRDVENINVVAVNEDSGLHDYLSRNEFDKIISTHFGDGITYSYEKYFDDSFFYVYAGDAFDVDSIVF